MTQYERAKNKAQATRRMYVLAGWTPEDLGPGSKEKRSCLEALASLVSIPADEYPGKVRLAAAISNAVGLTWRPWYWSAGDTITLEGLNVLLEGTINHLIDRGTRDADRLIDELQAAVPRTEHGTEPLPISLPRPGGSMKPPRPIPPAPSKQEPPMNQSDQPEERLTLEASVADMMATLSQVQTRPDELQDPIEPFTVAAVRFDDTSWMSRLKEISGWLRLHETLDDSSPSAFAASLARGLGTADDENLVESENPAALTDLGLERIKERLERALALQQSFQEQLESDNGSLASASAGWMDAWEDAQSEEESESSGPIVAESDVLPIQDLLGWAEDGKLNLTPSYQRGDVWPTADAQLLMESILRGIPLPSIILLRHEENNRSSYEVVDGKQRLTSILRFVGKHPRALARVRATAVEHGRPDLEDLFATDYPTFKKLWKQLTGEPLLASREREYYFPFPLRNDVKTLSGDLKGLAGKYYCQIRKEPVQVADQWRDVYEIFERTTAYKLPVIEYRKVTSEQIHEVFNLYNKQGKHLNAEEIRNALYQRLDLMRALLVAAGDIEDVEGAAPFLLSRWEDISSTPEILESYDFGKARFKRTKLLSWVASIIFYDLCPTPGAAPMLRSTAGQINAFLDRPMKDPRDPLRAADNIVELISLIDKGIDAHASVEEEAWAPSFRNSKGKGPWQELQLVASLVGVICAREVLGDELEDRLLSVAGTLASRSSEEWKRPAKTQTKNQWEYIAKTAVGIMQTLDVEPHEADRRMRERFGASGISGLVYLVEHSAHDE